MVNRLLGLSQINALGDLLLNIRQGQVLGHHAASTSAEATKTAATQSATTGHGALVRLVRLGDGGELTFGHGQRPVGILSIGGYQASVHGLNTVQAKAASMPGRA